MLSFVFAVYALPCTFVSDWSHERELCGANSPLWAHALCDNAQLLDEYCFRPDDYIAFICLPWKGEYLPICTEEDKARSFSRVRDIAMRAVCGASMSRNECYAKVLGSYGASLGGLQHSRRLWESRRGCYPHATKVEPRKLSRKPLPAA